MMRPREVAVTGIGIVSPAGCRPEEVLSAVAEGRAVTTRAADVGAGGFDCPYAGRVDDSGLDGLVRDRKSARLMGRDAFLAVAAARLAILDSGLSIGRDVQPGDAGLYGATGLAGLPFPEIEAMVHGSATDAGGFDPVRFGREGLRMTRPVTSFKILSNMPMCFVSIAEKIRGTNLILNPWEGQGALAVAEAARAIRHGEARVMLAGGCDYKSHNLAFVTLQQYGLFESWRSTGSGLIPGEGASFLVLEALDEALARGVEVHALIRGFGHASDHGEFSGHGSGAHPLVRAMGSALGNGERAPDVVFTGLDGDAARDAFEEEALSRMGLEDVPAFAAKKQVTNLFAAAAATNIALGAFHLSGRNGRPCAGSGHPETRTLVNCFGPGSEKISFILEAA